MANTENDVIPIRVIRMAVSVFETIQVDIELLLGLLKKYDLEIETLCSKLLKVRLFQVRNFLNELETTDGRQPDAIKVAKFITSLGEDVAMIDVVSTATHVCAKATRIYMTLRGMVEKWKDLDTGIGYSFGQYCLEERMKYLEFDDESLENFCDVSDDEDDYDDEVLDSVPNITSTLCATEQKKEPKKHQPELLFPSTGPLLQTFDKDDDIYAVDNNTQSNPENSADNCDDAVRSLKNQKTNKGSPKSRYSPPRGTGQEEDDYVDLPNPDYKRKRSPER